MLISALSPAAVKDWCLVWTLCEALWGHLKELEARLDEPTEYVLALERRRAFSRWLSQTAAERIKNEVSLAQNDSPAQAVFSYLTGKQISEACRLAQHSGKTAAFHLDPGSNKESAGSRGQKWSA